MGRVVTVEIKGLDELERNLEALPKEVERTVIREDLTEAAQIVVDAMVQEAPKNKDPNDPSAPQGFLAQHFAVKVTASSKDVSGTAIIGPAANVDYPDRDGSYRRKINDKGKVKLVGRIGVDDVARFLEFGTIKTPKNPFLTRAYELTKNPVLNKIISGIQDALAKVRK
jgi:HK97 gp10 family phage protein